MKEILIVLGSPNSPGGKLSRISKSRLDYCAQHYTEAKEILCTGGWGKHFNISNEPHALHAQRYLIRKGIPEKAFMDFALSENTVDDAVKIKEIVSKYSHPHLTVITSDYHIERVRLIFSRILRDFRIAYLGVKTGLTKEALQPLIDHEHHAIQSILKNGLYY